jgi:hypothetical protein
LNSADRERLADQRGQEQYAGPQAQRIAAQEAM